MGQVVETNDGLPFIGENANQEFIATGFCGNGYALSTLSAMMARDRYFDRIVPGRGGVAAAFSPLHHRPW